MRNRRRLLIFVIAYCAEDTLRSVLERIPRQLFDSHDCEVLVVDDASADRTAEIGREYRAHHPEIRMTVLRNQLNQGYGGNQKVGYAYALAEGFDYVAMIHGDGQYAPEELPRLLRPLDENQADAVFGSRMMTRFGALRGGMPLYKYVGNRILTTAQNALLGTRLTEFHSGYRVYATRALRQLRFLLNSNDFHFDTEIIIQLLNARLRIKELPIPTYYGDEISRVSGLKYAKNVMVATAHNAFHRAGLLHRRAFDPVVGEDLRHVAKLGWPSSHEWAVRAVPPRSRVIDFGAGPGTVARELASHGCQVTAVDRAPLSVTRGATLGITTVQQDLDQPLRFDVGAADHLLLLDVIEHLADPEAFLERLRASFDHRPKTVILTTPNIAFLVQRLMLLAGQFNYGNAGILDRTHHRLFTFHTITRLLSDHGFRIKEVRGVPVPFPKVLGNGFWGRLAVAANLALIRVSRTLFSYQVFIVAEGTPDVDFLLRDAKAGAALADAAAR